MKAIYKIENTITKDFYIGSAVDYNYRRWLHLHRLRKGKHHSPILQNSFKKYGEGAFLFSIVEEVLDKEKLIEREQYYIDTLNPRYNICRIAGSALGYKHTNVARLNMSLAHKGIKLKPESIAKRTASVLGSKRSQISIDKMRKTSCCKIILQYDLNNNFIKEWDSMTGISRELGISQSNISQCCRGIRKTYKKFIWKFKT